MIIDMKKNLLFIIIFITSLGTGFAKPFLSDTLVVAFWNLENLFDTLNDPQKNDEDFLPEGKQKWNSEKYITKLSKLASVIRLMNNGMGPDVLGVCEIENELVLKDLSGKYLSELDYEIVHIEGPDERSIDVALFIKKNKIKYLSKSGHPVALQSGSPTRLVLEINVLIADQFPVTFFVNHWPSRRGGSDESERNRIRAASVLKSRIDTLVAADESARIIIMGDFNDEPQNVSLEQILGAKNFECFDNRTGNNVLNNLSYNLKLAGHGSYKFRDQWNMLDQIIISRGLLQGNLSYICNSFEVFKPEMMVIQSGQYQGAPDRTFAGERYLGGFSDHFPVIAKFIYITK